MAGLACRLRRSSGRVRARVCVTPRRTGARHAAARGRAAGGPASHRHCAILALAATPATTSLRARIAASAACEPPCRPVQPSQPLPRCLEPPRHFLRRMRSRSGAGAAGSLPSRCCWRASTQVRPARAVEPHFEPSFDATSAHPCPFRDACAGFCVRPCRRRGARGGRRRNRALPGRRGQPRGRSDAAIRAAARVRRRLRSTGAHRRGSGATQRGPRAPCCSSRGERRGCRRWRRGELACRRAAVHKVALRR